MGDYNSSHKFPLSDPKGFKQLNTRGGKGFRRSEMSSRKIQSKGWIHCAGQYSVKCSALKSPVLKNS